MERKLVSKKLKDGKVLYYRENSSDMAMWKENPYKHFPFEKDDVILDIGANIGDIALRFSDKVKEIHSYEPMKDTFKVLTKNVTKNGIKNCVPYNVAVATTTGETTIYFNDKAKLSHASVTTVPVRGRKKIKVKTLSFADEVARVKPTIIKMDIEGGEYDILENVPDSLFDNCKLFSLEVHVRVIKQEDGIKWNQKIGKRFKKIFGQAKERKIYYFKNHECSLWEFQRKTK
jgi:FkbM family methyltransferase